MDIHFANGPDDLVTWIASSPGVMQRASHALALCSSRHARYRCKIQIRVDFGSSDRVTKEDLAFGDVEF